ncbi:MAG: hypothetical protein ACO1SX_14305 [Actinomycetota bacterium]
MSLENPFFVREIRQHVRRPLPVQVGLLAFTGLMSLALLVPLYFWMRDNAKQPPDGFVWFLVIPHLLFCAVAAVYATDRIFGDEHRRSTLETLRLLPISPSRWVLTRLAWPLFLVTLSWAAGAPFYVISALTGVGSTDSNLLLSLFALAVGLFAIPLVLLLPPDFRERMRTARLAGAHRRVKLDADLTLCWLINGGLWFLFQFSIVMMAASRGGRMTPFYATRVPLAGVWIAVALTVLLASAVASTATISQEERRESLALRARLLAVAVLYYSLIGLLTGLMWARLPFWAQWGPPLLFPLWAWFVLRRQARPREDPWSASEVDWAETRWANPWVTRDLRSFTRFSSIRRWVGGEAAAILGVYVTMVYFFVVKGGADLAQVTLGALTMGALLGAVIFVGDASARPFAMWMRERTTGALPMVFLAPRTSREILRGRLLSAAYFALTAHLPLLLLVGAGVAWHSINTSWVIGAAAILALPVSALFVVVLGCTVQPQTAPPWRWLLDDWLEVALSLAQVAILVADVYVLVEGANGNLTVAWAGASALFVLNVLLVYGCYLIRIRQFEALRLGERALTER